MQLFCTHLLDVYFIYIFIYIHLERAVEADVVQYVGTHKRVKHNEDTKDSSESSQNSTSVDNSE